LNDRVVTGAFMIDSRGPIELRTSGVETTRRYLGSIEVRPQVRGVAVINHVPTETYLEGVLNAEISTDWHIEVVKAQSVISRTFALHKRSARSRQDWHLSSGQYDQVYLGMNIADARGRLAIQSTRGVVVAFEGKLAQTFYHSNCGGTTEDPAHVWRVSLPYLRSIPIPYGQSDPRFHWEAALADGEIVTILRQAGVKIGRVEEIQIIQRTPSERVSQLSFMGDQVAILSGYDFRRLAGYKRVQSLLFDLVRVPGGFYLKGRGNGHGVGLSQWAAKEMAERGYTYADILHYFYQDVELRLFGG